MTRDTVRREFTMENDRVTRNKDKEKLTLVSGGVDKGELQNDKRHR